MSALELLIRAYEADPASVVADVCPATQRLSCMGLGQLGHEAISDAVQDNLTPSTAQAIARILGKKSLRRGDLAKASLWPDQIREVGKGRGESSGFSGRAIREARHFNAQHPKNAEWHYVNLPLGTSAYPDPPPTDPQDPLRRFVRSNDIVHVIQECIRILESPDEQPGWTKSQALRWLLHLVEDLHQPLHITTGYYRTADGRPHPPLLTDPAEAAVPEVVHDRGGTNILFGSSPDNNLHTMWDDCLVQRTARLSCGQTPLPADRKRLARQIKVEMTREDASHFTSAGDHRKWMIEWATETLEMARSGGVYDFGLKAGPEIERTSRHFTLIYDPPPSKTQYITRHQPSAAEQLLKAAVRLTDLLNHLEWQRQGG